jgi:hypothetical protein
VSLVEVLRQGVEQTAADQESKAWFEGAEGDAITLRFTGGNVISFSVKSGKLSLVDGDVPNPRGIAEVKPEVFVSFINGKKVFGGLFVHEMAEYFKPVRGEFYDFGGDFFLLNPVTERLAALYRKSAGFKQALDAC